MGRLGISSKNKSSAKDMFPIAFLMARMRKVKSQDGDTEDKVIKLIYEVLSSRKELLKPRNYTLLSSVACQEGLVGVLQMLKSDFGLYYSDKYFAFTACRKGHYELWKYLLYEVSQLNDDDLTTVLLEAIWSNRPNFVTKYLKNYCFQNVKCLEYLLKYSKQMDEENKGDDNKELDWAILIDFIKNEIEFIQNY